MTEKKFRVKIIGIVFDPKQRKILIGKNHNDDFFSFVDGKLEYDEELDNGLKRVVKRKTGYVIHNLGVIYANNHINQQNTDILELYFLGEIKKGEKKLGKGVKEIKWIKAEEFEKLSNQHLPSRLKEYISNICG